MMTHAGWPLSGNVPCATKSPPLQGSRDEGRQEGRQEGLRTVLERLPTKRFGPMSAETRQRLTQTTPEQLET